MLVQMSEENVNKSHSEAEILGQRWAQLDIARAVSFRHIFSVKTQPARLGFLGEILFFS